MRIRLMIDVILTDRDIDRLQRVVGEQPVTSIQIQGVPQMAGRFMGATMVEKEDHDESGEGRWNQGNSGSYV